MGYVQRRRGNRSENNAPRNAYCTKDEAWVAVSASATAVAARLMALVGHPEVADESWFASGAERAARSDLIDGYVADWIAQRTRAEVIDAFEAAQAAVAPVYDIAELMDDVHIVARDVMTTVDDPDLGALRMQDVLFRMSATPGSVRYAGRSIGADTDAVLHEELGITVARLDALRERGVVA